jgi:hypothetical protein
MRRELEDALRGLVWDDDVGIVVRFPSTPARELMREAVVPPARGEA